MLIFAAMVQKLHVSSFEQIPHSILSGTHDPSADMATVDEVTGNGHDVAETAIIHTLQLLERICTRNERVDNVTNSAT